MPQSNLDTIYGIGTDIIEVERIREAIGRHKERFLNRLFTPAEQAYCAQHRDSGPRYAGRFAAKEATLKAIGSGINADVTWTDIEIINDVQGKPHVRLSGNLQARFPTAHFFISISHCNEYATATAIVIGASTDNGTS